MAGREDRAADAKKHIALMDRAFSAEIAASIEGARIFQEGEGRSLELPEPEFGQTEVSVRRRSSLEALAAAKGSAVVLDSASFLRPGGGYEKGAWTQEEALCADSNLYPILRGMKEKYYDENRGYARGQLYTDRAMLLPDVQFNCNGNYKAADVIVMAAPNRQRALENHRSEAECDAELRRRIEAIMRIAVASGKETAVLGAFGCGFFGNDAMVVGGLFKAWLDEHPGLLKTVIFAIPGGPNLEVFEGIFGAWRPEAEQAKTEADAEGEEDEEAWDEGLTQTEDGRWVF